MSRPIVPIPCSEIIIPSQYLSHDLVSSSRTFRSPSPTCSSSYSTATRRVRDDGYHLAKIGKSSFDFSFKLPSGLPSSLPAYPLSIPTITTTMTGSKIRQRAAHQTRAGIEYELITSVKVQLKSRDPSLSMSSGGNEKTMTTVREVIVLENLLTLAIEGLARGNNRPREKKRMDVQSVPLKLDCGFRDGQGREEEAVDTRSSKRPSQRVVVQSPWGTRQPVLSAKNLVLEVSSMDSDPRMS